MESRLLAVISHITPIGWIIALIINSNNKQEYTSYFIRQNLAIYLAGILLSVIAILPILGWIISGIGSVILLIFWIMSLIWSLSGEMRPVPWFGEKAQEWFKGL